MDSITILKAEIFDILAQQDQHQYAISQLDKQKQEKLAELQKLIQEQQQSGV